MQPSTPPAISDYALIGDCRTAALVSRTGGIDWLCLPDFHSASLFARLLDRGRGGALDTAPPEATPVSRRYRDGTNVLETELAGPDGRVRLIDFLPIEPDDDAALEPERELIRIVEAVDGAPEVCVAFDPAPDYARAAARIERRGGLGWHLRHDGTSVYLRSDIALAPDGGSRLAGRARLAPGERRTLSLSQTRRDPAVLPLLGSESEEKLERTTRWWRAWTAGCTYDGPYREAVRRSALALKALQYGLSGAVLAAATTSLPEALGAGRNWDYRYCWLRDAAFTLRAFAETGHGTEAAAFFDWLMHATRMTQPRLQALYDVFGRTRLEERELGHLAGYRGSRPVRVGNGAHDQLQLDVYGALIGAATAFVHAGGTLDRAEARLLARLGETVCDSWQQPDNGIWEFREGRRHNTWSKVMCWSALDRLLDLAGRGVVSVPRARLEETRGAIAEAIHRHAWDPELGSYVGAFGERFLDATLLLMPRAGLLDARDPRMQATWRRIEERLQDGCLIHRYDHGTDDQQGREGAFVICSFWAVEHLARCGRTEEARERMEALLGCANDVGLLSEEIDPRDHTMLGNFPQAFSHSGLINAAIAIAEAEAGGTGEVP